MYKTYELTHLKDAISIWLRKKSGNTNITADDMLDETFVNNLVHHDDGYYILKNLRSSSAHWEAEKKKFSL